MIDVGGAALLGAAARNGGRRRGRRQPRALREARGRAQAPSRGERGAAGQARRGRASGSCAAYYAEIAAYLNLISNTTFPNRLAVVLEKVDDLRYGENPHQRAAFYRETTHRSGTLADATQLRGDRPSFNNYLDLDTAYRIARDFTTPTVAIVKHTDPVGVAHVGRARRGLPPRARDRLRGRVRRDRRRQPRARRLDRPRDRGEQLRGGRRARLQPGGARDPEGRRPASRSSPSRRIRPRGCATTGSPTSTSSESPAASSSRASTRSVSTAAGSRS